ncbi:hypothetical protein Pcinc_002571 [Petrolisthes cinctipes]|uniref:Uncharacterized protein n=1 Tax=Petrolisthes cinctipes TaxID=88211 RepID=A0AAE1L2V1_PETCI|nr:hypothetical protein Pcinc_002571 [Petrolisthes cinctipes]
MKFVMESVSAIVMMNVVGMACGIGPEVMNKDLVMIHARKIPSTFLNFKTTVSNACWVPMIMNDVTIDVSNVYLPSRLFKRIGVNVIQKL